MQPSIRAALQPEAEIVLRDGAVAQPARLRDMVSEGAAQGVIGSGMLHRPEKFANEAPIGSRVDVLMECPPTVVIQALHRGVGAGEARNIALHPLNGIG